MVGGIRLVVDMTNRTSFVQELLNLIARGELPLALERMLNYLRGVGERDLVGEVTLSSARLHRVQREERQNLVSPDDARREIARITAATIEFLRELPDRLAVRASSPVSGPAIALELPTDLVFEKIFGINHLKRVAWLEEGVRVAQSVCRIVADGAVGSGFIGEHGWVWTNHHVLGSAKQAREASIELGFEEDLSGCLRSPTRYRLDAASFRTSERLDVSVAKLAPDPLQRPASDWGHLKFERSGPPSVGDHVSIIQHPDGGPKMIAVTANQVVNIFQHRLQYLTDTLPGSSGSPVFNDAWRVVAIHHAGGNLVANHAGDRRFANEGILVAEALAALGVE
jgi:S1-C subfamily serine protease